MPGFGCSTGETCNKNKCTSTCTPKSKADLCYSAQLKSGIECGTIPDGCGGSVNCGDLPAFRCGGGGTCGDDNRCVGGSKPATPPGTDYEQCEGSQDNPELCPSTPVKGDPGDDESTTHPSSTRTAKSDQDSDEPAAKSTGVASSGCSSAPGGSSSGLGSVALAFLVMLGARRRRAASPR
jgi:MYXO-CTERM domain-containing protein